MTKPMSVSSISKSIAAFLPQVCALALLGICPQTASAQVIASDNAGNSAYTTTFVGVDGGTGFAAWTAGTPGANSGTYLGTTGLGATTFGIYSGNTGSMSVYRKFDNALRLASGGNPGDTFRLDLGYTGVSSPNGRIGINLYSAGQWRLNFEFAGGDNVWRVKDNTGGSYEATNIGWAGGTGWGDAAPDTLGSTLTFALTRGGNANEYKLDISQGLATFSTGSAFYTAGSGATSIDEVEIYTNSQGADQNVGFNNLEIIPEPSSASLIGLGLAGLVALRKTRKA